MDIRKCIKIIFIVTFLLLLFSMPFSATHASSLGEVVEGADSFIDKGTQSTTPITSDALNNLSDNIYNILLIIGTVIAVIVGAILGIQFITGSVEQKSKVKETLIPYIVGCIVIFGAFGIWKLAIEVLRAVA